MPVPETLKVVATLIDKSDFKKEIKTSLALNTKSENRVIMFISTQIIYFSQ